MKPLPEILMLLICTIICQGAVISPSDQQESKVWSTMSLKSLYYMAYWKPSVEPTQT